MDGGLSTFIIFYVLMNESLTADFKVGKGSRQMDILLPFNFNYCNGRFVRDDEIGNECGFVQRVLLRCEKYLSE